MSDLRNATPSANTIKSVAAIHFPSLIIEKMSDAQKQMNTIGTAEKIAILL